MGRVPMLALRRPATAAPSSVPLPGGQPLPGTEGAGSAAAPARRKPELWRAFQQNDENALGAACCPARRSVRLKPRAADAESGAAPGGAAPLVPVAACGLRRVRMPGARGPAPGRAGQQRATDARAEEAQEGAARQKVRRLAPIPRPSQLGKRKAEGGLDAQTKRATRPRNLPMCLCCGGLLRNEDTESLGGENPDSCLLKCTKCGLISRVAS